jgi:hypothetical protein
VTELAAHGMRPVYQLPVQQKTHADALGHRDRDEVLHVFRMMAEP